MISNGIELRFSKKLQSSAEGMRDGEIKRADSEKPLLYLPLLSSPHFPFLYRVTKCYEMFYKLRLGTLLEI